MKQPDTAPQNAYSEDMLQGRRMEYVVTASTFQIQSKLLYSNPLLAVMRELGTTNPADEYVRIGKPDGIIRIMVPTETSPSLVIRDFASGIPDPEKMLNVYFAFNASDKREDNNQTGQMGIGAKAAFAIADQFQVSSYDGTRKAVYHAYMDDDGFPCVRGPFYTDDDGPAGLEVSIPYEPVELKITEDRPIAEAAVSYIRKGSRSEKFESALVTACWHLSHRGSAYKAKYVEVVNQAGDVVRVPTMAILRDMEPVRFAKGVLTSLGYGYRARQNGLFINNEYGVGVVELSKPLNEPMSDRENARQDFIRRFMERVLDFSQNKDGVSSGCNKIHLALANIVYPFNKHQDILAPGNDGDYEEVEQEDGISWMDQPNITDFLPQMGTIILTADNTQSDCELPPVRWTPSRESLILTDEMAEWSNVRVARMLCKGAQDVLDAPMDFKRSMVPIEDADNPTLIDNMAGIAAVLLAFELIKMAIDVSPHAAGEHSLGSEVLNWTKGLVDTPTVSWVYEELEKSIGEEALKSLFGKDLANVEFVTHRTDCSLGARTRHGELRERSNSELLKGVGWSLIGGMENTKATYMLITGTKNLKPLVLLNWLRRQTSSGTHILLVRTDKSDHAALLAERARTHAELCGYSSKLKIETYLEMPPDSLPPKKERTKRDSWISYELIRTLRHSQAFPVNVISRSSSSHKALAGYAVHRSKGDKFLTDFPSVVDGTLFAACQMRGTDVVISGTPIVLSASKRVDNYSRGSGVFGISGVLHDAPFGVDVTTLGLRQSMQSKMGMFDGHPVDVLYQLFRVHWRKCIPSMVARVIEQAACGTPEPDLNDRKDDPRQYYGRLYNNVIPPTLGNSHKTMQQRIPSLCGDPIVSVVDKTLGEVQQRVLEVSQLDRVMPSGALPDRLLMNAVDWMVTMLDEMAITRAYTAKYDTAPIRNAISTIRDWVAAYEACRYKAKSWCDDVYRYMILRYPHWGHVWQMHTEADKKAMRGYADTPLYITEHTKDYLRMMDERWARNDPRDEAVIREQREVLARLRVDPSDWFDVPAPPYVQFDPHYAPNVWRIAKESARSLNMVPDLPEDEFIPS